MTYTGNDWQNVKLTGAPILVVGLLGIGDRIEGYRVILDKNVHPPLLAIAKRTLAETAAKEGVDYSPYVEPGVDEYLTLDPVTLTVPDSDNDDGVRTERGEAAVLAKLVQYADTLPELGAGQLIQRLDQFKVQIIRYRSGGEPIGFVTKATARQVFKRSAIPLGQDRDTDRFKRIERPEVVVESDIHAIMTPTDIAILNKTQFQFMVSDAKLVQGFAKGQVGRIARRLKRRGIPLSATTSAVLVAQAEGSVQLAKRLDALADRVEQLDIIKVASGEGFKAQDLVADDFINKNGELECLPDRVGELVDALEGRFFGDPLSAEQRRADSFRTRRRR